MTQQDMRNAFMEKLPADRQQIEAEWTALQAAPVWNAGLCAPLIQSIHRLAGSALTVGYSRLGNAARQLETYLKAGDYGNRSSGKKHYALLLVEMQALHYDGVVENEQQTTQTIKNVPSLQEMRSFSLIYLVDDDPVLAETLAAQVRHFGYSIRCFTRLRDLSSALEKQMPTAILMDIIFPEGELAGIETIRALQQQHNNQLPVFFLSMRDDVETRLRAIRSGGKNYFVKPVDIGALVDALDKTIVSADSEEQFRVLIVDDVEIQAKINAMHLARAGIASKIVTNPYDVLNALEDYLPDLLLLDLYMPECTGLELAQVIRQMKAFVSLPIVYLSAETDREKQLVAVGLGGDDFLTKPIKPDHLVTAVRSRIERYRQLRALMLRDSLTGLFNHTSVRERLGQELVRTARTNQPLALAMIDIDHFKQVNDIHGHATGDRVLKALTHILVRRLRQSDIIGRYGGEEFIVILPGTDEDTALCVMNELRDGFSQVHHNGERGEFCVTFSCGVAVYPTYQSPTAISEAADRALYSAKAQGRNRVVLAER